MQSHITNEHSRSTIENLERITSTRPIQSITSVSSTMHKAISYKEAMSYYERALKIYDREFEADHINSAKTINNLGNVYNSQGNYKEAISYYERALKIKDREFETDHINSARTINNINILYDTQD